MRRLSFFNIIESVVSDPGGIASLMAEMISLKTEKRTFHINVKLLIVPKMIKVQTPISFNYILPSPAVC